MIRPLGSMITTVLVVFILIVVLLLSLFILISPTQAGQAVLRRSVDIAATAQAIQSHNRLTELEATGQAQKTTWESEISKKQQALADLNQNNQTQADQLQTQLNRLKAQIDEVTAELHTTQNKIIELQRLIEEDRVNYQNDVTALEQEMGQIEGELQNKLDLTNAAKQAAYDELTESQAETITPSTIGAGEGDQKAGDEYQDDKSGDDGADDGESRNDEDRGDNGHDDKDEEKTDQDDND